MKDLKHHVHETQSVRERMVETQLAHRGIHDERILAAFRHVPRERFMPENMRHEAYEDFPVPIGEAQTISQPYIVALMTELLELNGRERALEIGTGSGYQTAILAELVGHVYTVEIVPSLAKRAREVLTELGYENVSFRIGDGTEGWAEEAPFDRILLTAAPKTFPPALEEQLRVGGIAVAPVGGFLQELRRYVREPDGMRIEEHGGVRFVPMTGKAWKLEA